ncbi:hypothetical protein B0T26DRAFT_686643 [Lasiosphaeria miniovina]|uniref:Uncharacterized protein n=1 Tax=Lasiosphaeria miniovina TaxID=1954250 RepID=A0AA40BGU3_9PEZI|nr:uncharacterized protein B0T26DRAFT_686643 [Lasiosphaeria miniovina]KAK0733981.1 hypothetical protein B0T26DRAFT_686643 [Lasiosphaeria miniovina]
MRQAGSWAWANWCARVWGGQSLTQDSSPRFRAAWVTLIDVAYIINSGLSVSLFRPLFLSLSSLSRLSVCLPLPERPNVTQQGNLLGR